MAEAAPIRVGQRWQEKDRRVLIPAEVLEYDGDAGFVRLQRGSRKTRVRVSNLRSRYRLVQDVPARAPHPEETNANG